ncbi:MAG: Nitroreductase family protein [Pelotomaculum sp. PtaB.Bin104]|nr:MAG: Nitroreductase family protein [Pelotomaculum sp. PtaB.Bin104]
MFMSCFLSVEIFLAPMYLFFWFRGNSLVMYRRISKDNNSIHIIIGKNNDNKVEYDIGYYGEAFILSAIFEGLGTCWINGTFNPDGVNKDMNISEDERIYAVTPFGYPAESEAGVHKFMRFVIGSAKRKTIEQISNISEIKDKQD